MKRISYLVFIATATFLIVLYIKRPDLFAGFKPWFLGIVAPIIAIIKKLYEKAKDKAASLTAKKETAETDKKNIPVS